MQIKTVNVTQRDIEAATKARDSGNYDILCECPIARAIGRLKLGKKVTWAFDTGQVYSNENAWGESLTHELTAIYPDSRATKSFVHTFDSRREVEPFKFKVEVANA
jgi:hypothetical protein